MRRFLASDLPDRGTFLLAGEEGEHLARVLRAAPGDEVLVFDGRGREARCRIESATRSEVVLAVLAATTPPRARRDVMIAAAAPRGERMEWLVEKCVEAGASSVVALAAERSVRDRCSPNVLRRWRRAAVEAAKQCGRADLPEVTEPQTLGEAIRRASGRLLLVASPGAEATLDAVVAARDPSRVAVFVGPEGGFAPEESASLAAAGAVPFGLGPRILRIETAAAIAAHLASR